MSFPRSRERGQDSCYSRYFTTRPEKPPKAIYANRTFFSFRVSVRKSKKKRAIPVGGFSGAVVKK